MKNLLAAVAATLATVLCAGLAPAQRTFVVAAGGGGQFTDLPEAIAAARPGDTLLVRAGSYSPFSVSIGIRILGEPGATAGHLLSAFGVRNLPAGQTLVLRQLSPSSQPAAARVSLQDNSGHVHFENMFAMGGISIVNCAQVSLKRVTTTGGMPAGLEIDSSTVIASQCRVTGLAGFGTVPGLDCKSSDVVFADGECTGAGPGFRSDPSPGVRLVSGELTITGDRETRIQAGVGSPPAPAVLVSAGSLVLAPSVTLTSTAAMPVRVVGGTVVHRTMPALQASVGGRLLTAWLLAPGGNSAFLIASLPLSPPLSLPFGKLWLQVTHGVLAGGRVTLGRQITVSTLPPLAPGSIAVLQSAVLTASGFELSMPVVLTLDG